MENPKEYIMKVMDSLEKRNRDEKEFLNGFEKLFKSLIPVLEKHPEYMKENLLERIAEPEKQMVFKVPWVDDRGGIHVNRGFRIQYNAQRGVHKGGLMFHPHVNIEVLKKLAFTQLLKNSLTGLSLGGAYGGSDFDLRGKSHDEVRRFCQSYTTELYRYIGKDIDVPAGGPGVSGESIGYLFGQYRRITGNFSSGVITGKGEVYGGIRNRAEGIGYGAVFFAEEIMKFHNTDFKGKTFALSGMGNVPWGAAKKIKELGGKVVTLSGPDGYIYDRRGIITEEKLDYMIEMKASGRFRVEDYAERFGCEFFPGEKPWGRKVDVVMPCATQRDIHLEHAKKIVENGIKYVIEGSNLPITKEAVEYLIHNDVVVAPSTAANAGGVILSALEMSQNNMGIQWEMDEIENHLRGIMKGIHKTVASASLEYGYGYNLVEGANIAGFLKLAEGIIGQGDS